RIYRPRRAPCVCRYSPPAARGAKDCLRSGKYSPHKAPESGDSSKRAADSPVHDWRGRKRWPVSLPPSLREIARRGRCSLPIPHQFAVAEVEFVRGIRIERPLDAIQALGDIAYGAAVTQPQMSLKAEFLARHRDHSHFFQQKIRKLLRIFHVGAEIREAVKRSF